MIGKKEGSAHIIIVCFMGFVMLFLYLLMGLTQLQLEYDTAILNENVSEAILAADYMDQYMAAGYGYVVFDCSSETVSHCVYESCLYEGGSETTAYASAYTKAKKRFLESICDSLSLAPDLAVSSDTPCGIASVELKDFRSYNVIDSVGRGLLSEGKTYMKTPGMTQWFDNVYNLTAPNGDRVETSGIYVDLEFTVKTFFKTTKIPVRTFVGIKN